MGEREKVRLNPIIGGRAAHICLFIAALSVVLGVIGEVLNIKLGLEIMFWLVMIGAAFFVTFIIGWVASRFSATTETQEED